MTHMSMISTDKISGNLLNQRHQRSIEFLKIFLF